MFELLINFNNSGYFLLFFPHPPGCSVLPASREEMGQQKEKQWLVLAFTFKGLGKRTQGKKK